MRRLTVSELLTATGGTLLAGGASAAVTSVSTDSRKAGEGALFIPLTGERFDGHDYIDKALALGADAVLIGRPFVTTVYGGEEEGVQLYVQKLKAELADTMRMCGAHSLAEIKRSMLFGF